eukprot:5334477-Pyramimonas_sp.AAC.1
MGESEVVKLMAGLAKSYCGGRFDISQIYEKRDAVLKDTGTNLRNCQPLSLSLYRSSLSRSVPVHVLICASRSARP